jgi:hypothetical protein
MCGTANDVPMSTRVGAIYILTNEEARGFFQPFEDEGYRILMLDGMMRNMKLPEAVDNYMIFSAAKELCRKYGRVVVETKAGTTRLTPYEESCPRGKTTQSQECVGACKICRA